MSYAICVQQATTGGAQPVQLDNACRLIALNCNTNVAVTGDPSLAITEATSPAASGIRRNIVAMVQNAMWAWWPFDVAPEFSAGETIYVIFTSKGSCILHFQPIT